MYSAQSNIFLFCLSIIVFWFLLWAQSNFHRTNKCGQRVNVFSCPKGAILFCVVVSLYYSITTIVFTDIIIYRDIVDFFRPFIYLLVFVFGISTSRVFCLRKIYKIFYVVFFLQFFFNFLIFVPGADAIVKVYRPQDSGLNYIKFSGTFGFSYTYVFFCIFCGMWGFFKYIDDRKRSDLFLFFFGFLAIVLSGSRAGMLTYIILLMVVPFLSVTNNYGRRLLLKFFLFCTILIVFSAPFIVKSEFFSSLISYSVRLFELGFDDPSARRRVGELLMAVEILSENFLFGLGSSKHYFNEILGVHLESLYSYHLAKWGLIGFVFYVFHIYLIAKISAVAARITSLNPVERSLCASLVVTCVSIFILGFSISPTDSYIGPLWFYFAVGLGFGVYLHSKRRPSGFYN